MVTFGTLELPNCELNETTTVDTNIITFVSPAGVVMNKQKFDYINKSHSFKITLVTSDQRNDLIAYLEANYGQIITIDTGDSPLGIFDCLLLQEPLQIIETATNIFEIEFKAMVEFEEDIAGGYEITGSGECVGIVYPVGDTRWESLDGSIFLVELGLDWDIGLVVGGSDIFKYINHTIGGFPPETGWELNGGAAPAPTVIPHV